MSYVPTRRYTNPEHKESTWSQGGGQNFYKRTGTTQHQKHNLNKLLVYAYLLVIAGIRVQMQIAFFPDCSKTLLYSEKLKP